MDNGMTNGRLCRARPIQRDLVSDDLFASQVVGGVPTHDRQHIASLNECATPRLQRA